MKKTVIATTIAALLATSALPAVANNAGLDLDLGAGVSLDSDLLTAQTDVGVDADVDASEDGVSVDAGAGVDAGVDADESLDADVGVDANAGASVDDDRSFDALSAAISSSADVDLSAVTDESDITIVLVSGLDGDIAIEGAGLDEDLAASADAQASLQANIDGNAAIKAKLEAEGYAASDVVAVKSKADGSVLVYVDDRA